MMTLRPQPQPIITITMEKMVMEWNVMSNPRNVVGAGKITGRHTH
jgi:hypothetical protein